MDFIHIYTLSHYICYQMGPLVLCDVTLDIMLIRKTFCKPLDSGSGKWVDSSHSKIQYD